MSYLPVLLIVIIYYSIRYTIKRFRKRMKLKQVIKKNMEPKSEEEVFYCIFKQLWVSSKYGAKEIEHLWFTTQEISKSTNVKREQIKNHINDLISSGILNIKSHDPLIYKFSEKGKLIKKKVDINNLRKSFHNKAASVKTL